MAETGWSVALAAAALGVETTADGRLAAVVTDSRQVGPGDLFVALRGERFDAHDFVAQAVARGAGAVVVDRPVDVPAGCVVFQVDDTLLAYGRLAAAWRRRHEAKVLAVTGSTGKSSTKEVLATVLATRCVTLSAEKSFNNEVGVPATLLKLTPAHQAVVLELAMRGEGQIDYLARIARPVVGVITNIGMSHLELLGSREAIARAKGELLDHLGADGVAVLNQDSPGLAAQAGRHAGRTIWYGFDAAAEVRAADVELHGLSGSRFRLVTAEGEAMVEFGLPGRHMISNALAAAAAGLAAGLELDDVVTGLGAARNLPLRLEVIALPGGRRLINDAYNAAPDSVRAALQVLASEPAARRVVCLGEMLEMGAVAEAEHLRVGHDAAAVADVVVAVGELGRYVADGARDAGHPAVYHVADVHEVGRLLATLTRTGDLILLKASRAVGLEAVVANLERGG